MPFWPFQNPSHSRVPGHKSWFLGITRNMRKFSVGQNFFRNVYLSPNFCTAPAGFACLLLNADRWIVFPPVASDEFFRFNSLYLQGANAETLCRSLWWYCNANVLFSVKYQALPSITFCMKNRCNRQLAVMFGGLPSARRMTPRRRTRNQNWRASTCPSEPVVRGDLVPSSDIFQEVPDQEPISKMMIDSNEMILGCEQWSNMVVVSREILYNK